jgi:hypothetical protein
MKRVTLYVPTQSPVQRGEWALLSLALLHTAGGFAEYAHEGAWRNDEGEIFRERGVTVTVLTENLNPVLEAFRVYGKAAGEQTLAWTVEEVDAHFEAVGEAA